MKWHATIVAAAIVKVTQPCESDTDMVMFLVPLLGLILVKIT
jgi:hypothetical protein